MSSLPRVDVLIIDDDEDTREILADLVRRAGFDAATACNGLEAIELLRTMRPDLILLDVQMPLMDGPTFRQEQRHNREWLQIPTIVMTGSADETMLDVAVEDTLRKPISAKTLIAAVANHCTRDVK